MVIKKIEIECCDFCDEQAENLTECEVCGKKMCENCSVDEDWAIPDTPLCEGCHDKVWKNMTEYMEKLKTGE